VNEEEEVRGDGRVEMAAPSVQSLLSADMRAAQDPQSALWRPHLVLVVIGTTHCAMRRFTMSMSVALMTASDPLKPLMMDCRPSKSRISFSSIGT
jgi:hypothetical protein